ncbi:MAG: hypothetical protein KAT09_04095 [Candidatus Aegiribacteria sp.]|nr:hypothetical protein [Candidatus Aegiribacteria sp.]
MKTPYIVISHERLLNAAEGLINSKRLKGYDVEVRTVNDIIQAYPGPEGAWISIRAYLEALIVEEDISSGCLLLIGDGSLVPGFPQTYLGNTFESDSYYTILGREITPILATGRLSSNDPEVIGHICDALLNYPQATIKDYEAKRIVLTGWIPRDFQAKHYWRDPGWSCTREIDKSRYHVSFRFENDETIIGQTSTLGDGDNRRSIWRVADTSKQDLITSIERGSLIVRYNGHGADTCWTNIGITGEPEQNFCCSDVTDLAQTHLLPFVISLACHTGDITPFQSFAETWQSQLKAIGVYAADEPGNTAWDDQIFQRILKEVFTGKSTQIGIILDKAIKKIYHDFKNSPEISEECLIKLPRMFRYFGDPDTEILVRKRSRIYAIMKDLLYLLLRILGINPIKIMGCIEQD